MSAEKGNLNCKSQSLERSGSIENSPIYLAKDVNLFQGFRTCSQLLAVERSLPLRLRNSKQLLAEEMLH